MKTEELAKEFLSLSQGVQKKNLSAALVDFSKALKKVESIDHVKYLKKVEMLTNQSNESDLALNILFLYNMSQIAKKDWLNFAARNQIKINLNVRDSARDIIGKILKFLAENPNVLKTIELKVKKAKNENQGRQEIEDTINTLLKM